MELRPQDVLASLLIALHPSHDWTYPQLAEAAGLSLSEAHAAVQRAMGAGLVNGERKANRTALLEFLLHGLKYVFVPERGRLTRGIPTAHAAPPLVDLIGASTEPPPVWPDADGTVRGESFEPLFRSVPSAAKKDARLYEALALIDAIRGGRARERALAQKQLREMLSA
jgi:hypothetical protein